MHGHHPHVLQGVEFYKRGIIAYSLGNFIFDQINEICRESTLLFAELKGDSLTAVSLVPLEIVKNRPVPAGKAKSKTIHTRLQHLCRKLGTVVLLEDQTLQLRPAAKRSE